MYTAREINGTKTDGLGDTSVQFLSLEMSSFSIHPFFGFIEAPYQTANDTVFQDGFLNWESTVDLGDL